MTKFYLESVFLENFGAYKERPIGPFKPELTLVFGSNASGKTTLTQAVEGVLWGWVQERKGVNSYKPKTGSQEVQLRFKSTMDNQSLVLTRRKNAEGIQEVDAAQNLLRDIDKESYTTLFSLNSERLRELKDPEVLSSKLLCAGSGTLLAPSDALKKITDELSDLTSKKKDIEASLPKLKEAKMRLMVQIREEENRVLSLEGKDVELQVLRQKMKDMKQHRSQLLPLLSALAELKASLEHKASQAQELTEKVLQIKQALTLEEQVLSKTRAELVSPFDTLSVVQIDALIAELKQYQQELALSEQQCAQHLDELKQKQEELRQTQARLDVCANQKAHLSKQIEEQGLPDLNRGTNTSGQASPSSEPERQGASLFRGRMFKLAPTALLVTLAVAFFLFAVSFVGFADADPVFLRVVAITFLFVALLMVGLWIPEKKSKQEYEAQEPTEQQTLALQEKLELLIQEEITAKAQCDLVTDQTLAAELRLAQEQEQMQKLIQRQQDNIQKLDLGFKTNTLAYVLDLASAQAEKKQQLENLEGRVGKLRSELALTQETLDTVSREIEGLIQEQVRPYLASIDQETLLAPQAGAKSALVSINQALAVVRQSEEDLNTSFTQAADQVARLEEQLRQGAQEHSFDEKKLELEQVKTRIDDALERFCVLSLAESMLIHAMEDWASTDQPVVYQRAQELFVAMTQGAYSYLGLSLSGKLVVEDAYGRRFEPKHLSLATVQQLYLALRLALLEVADEVGGSIPILADDILVHFDDERAKATADVLREFAKKRQLIMFTSHERTLKLMGLMRTDACVVNL